MPNVDFDDLIPQILPECRQCSEPQIINEIRNVARHFCEKTTYWRADHAAITTVTDESATGEYALTIPAGAQIVSVIDPINHNADPVHRATKDWLDTNYPDWRTKTGLQAEAYRMVAPATIRLIPYPITAQADALLVSMVLKPSKTATNIIDTVYDEWYEGLAAGVLARLLSMENEAWYKPKRAVIMNDKYEEAIDDASSKAVSEFNHNKVDRRKRTKAHYF